MRRLLSLITLFVLSSVAAHAQQPRTSGTISATDAAVTLTIGTHGGTAVAVSSGTWSATLNFEVSADCTTYTAQPRATVLSSGALGSTSTSNGTFLIPLEGFQCVRVRANPYSSGTATVVLAASQASGVVSLGQALPTGSNTIGAVTGSGTFAVSASSLPLPTGAATLAEQQTQTTALQLIDNLPVAQGSTTSGQSGLLTQGAVSTSAPSYTNGQTSPLSIDTSGNLRVAVTGGGSNAAAGATGAAVPSSASYTAYNSGGNLVGVSTSNRFPVTCDNCGGGTGGTATADNGTYTAGTTNGTPIEGALDDTGTTAASEDKVAIARITAQRGLHVNLRNNSGTEIGTSSNPVQVTVANTGANSTAIKVDGSAVTQPVSGTVTANAGSGTFTNQQSNNTADYDTGAGTQTMTMFGVALPASGGSVAGGTSTNPLRVDPTGTTTQPVSGTVTANAGSGTMAVSMATQTPSGSVAHDGAASSVNPVLIGGYASAAAPTDVSADTDSVRAWHLRSGAYVTQPTFGGVLQSTGNGTAGTGTPRVTIASDNSAFTVNAAQSGTWTVQPGNTANTTAWLVAGGKTNNNAAPGATNFGVLNGIANASAPTWTEGNQVGASYDLSGAQRVTGSISCSNCSGSGASKVDDAAFTIATDSVAPAGFLADQTSPDSVNEGDVGLARMTLARIQLNTLWDAAGNERGANVTAGNALSTDQTSIAGTATSVNVGASDAGTQRVQLAYDGAVTLQASQVSGTTNATTTRTTTTGLGAYSSCSVLVNITNAGAATGTLQLFLQDSVDGGTTWNDWISSNTFTFGAATTTQAFFVSGQLSSSSTQGAAVNVETLTAGTARQGPFGDRIRVREKVSGVSGSPTGVTYVISAVCKR